MKMPEEVAKRIEYIKEFAEKMGYTTYEENLPGYKGIYLNVINDFESNSYYWGWNTDTWEEF